MGGKAAILLVLGFSIVFLVVGYNFNNVASNSLDNYYRYYNESVAYNIAVSGANMAASELFFDETWDDGFQNLSLSGGELNVYVANPVGANGGSSPVPSGKVVICHKPDSILANAHTILISQNALSAHLAHGDVIGRCAINSDSTSGMKITVISEGTVDFLGETITRTTVVELLPSKMSKFAYFQGTPSTSIWWNSGDTVWGPMHVQGDLQVANKPVFYGKVTSEGGIDYYDSGSGYYDYQQTGTRMEYQEVGGHWETVKYGKKTRTIWVAEYAWVEVPVYTKVWVSTTTDDPQFYGGYESGIDLPMPEDGVEGVREAAYDGGYVFTGHDTVIITFKKDSINYKFTSTDPTGTTVLGSSFTSNGVIFIENGTLRISGVVSGSYTVGVNGSSGYHSNKGNIYIDNDLVYNDATKDVLGLVAQNDILITNNAANNNDVNIQGSLYSEEGGFGAEDYNSRPVSGDINLYGGIIQYERLAVGTFNGTNTTAGFNKRYKYDSRLLLISPPAFPGTGYYEIVSWFE